ncbi:MAG: SAM-dependent chlorinase/fluorinase [Planctomycetes bacterium]|nr:SAM-dependent chlorinase/fluorinase [Planctomycetota bacterium]
MRRQPLITLLTDFGRRDPFVGIMKGVIAGLNPRALVIDLSHEVEPQNVRQGGIFWMQAVPFFPPGTIHVGVVDPGVGSGREILAARARGAIFLAPDNGMLGLAARRDEIEEAYLVRSRRWFLPRVSQSFHGRDLFAPVAAWLSKGLPLNKLGPAARSFQLLSLPRPERSRPRGAAAVRLAGEIIDIDRFGNCLTNLEIKDPARVLRIRAGRLAVKGLRQFYGAVPEGCPLALVGSAGLVEIAVAGGSAQEEWGLKIGQKIVLDLRR